MEKRDVLKLTFRQWAMCYAGSLGFGGVTWWATGNPWIGGGVLVGFTAVYVFSLAGKARDAAPVEHSQGMSRQQKRALGRKNKK
jgi:hypothetical protein